MKDSLARLKRVVSTWDATGWTEGDLTELEALIELLKKEAASLKPPGEPRVVGFDEIMKDRNGF